MRKIFSIFLCLTVIFALAMHVSASTTATSVTSYATVNNNGNCDITIHVQLRLDSGVKELSFPVPNNAINITLNGTQARTRLYGNTLHVDLAPASGSNDDTISFTIAYSLESVVSNSEAGTPQIQIPLLSGFAYPIEALEYSVTIPGQITAKPAFESGYHQASIEESLSSTTSGNTVFGHSLKNLKDHETLTMTLAVDKGMFPAPPVPLEAALFDDIGMIACGVLALLYWLLALRTKPLRGEKTDMPPAGFTAGEMGSLLNLQKANLTLMVLHWAQLGYILIQMDRNKRVFLHKRMSMGNERSAFEQKCFNSLFAAKKTIDTSSLRYAILCQRAEILSPNIRPMISRKSGNVLGFRLLCAGIGLFGGMSLGFSLVSSIGWQWFWAIVLAGLGTWSAWRIQQWANCLLTANWKILKTALYLCIPWLLLSIPGDLILVGILVPLTQFVGGFFAAFGGRRTEEGYQAVRQVLGLRRYLRTLSPAQLQRIMETDPDYFHDFAPYALALGVDKSFARAFGKSGIAPCPYLTTGMDGHRPAMEWIQLMHEVMASMERRRKQMAKERFQKLLSTIRK